MPALYAINAILVALFVFNWKLPGRKILFLAIRPLFLSKSASMFTLTVSHEHCYGYLGQLPLGHAGFMSIGSYACAIFIIRMMPSLDWMLNRLPAHQQ